MFALVLDGFCTPRIGEGPGQTENPAQVSGVFLFEYLQELEFEDRPNYEFV